MIARWPALAPFRTRSFRYQWPADLCTAWALEMETLILGSYGLVRTSDERFRGRVMGVRMLAIYTLPLGLLAAGPLIPAIGFRVLVALYVGLGLAMVAAVALVWRAELLPRGARANALR